VEEFFARLKEHKLVQWLLGYAAVAVALIPVLDIVAAQFGWPESLRRGITLAVIMGFFMVLVLAWYHGERGAQKMPRSEVLLLVGLVVITGVLMWRVAPSGHEGVSTVSVAKAAAPAPESTATPARMDIPAKSIAVLPFENLSTDKGNAYFADGMQDLILTKLADIGDLKVISRTSTMKYASHPDDLKTIAQQLGVATILEGSVQKAGDQVLINVQLIDAKTDSHLWAESYTRDLTNIFGVEGEVAGKVADALKARLSPGEAAAVASVPTKDPAAYDAYLRGEHYLDQMWAGDFAVVPKAVAAFREATDHDPQFALAWAQLALSQSMLSYASIDTSDATRQQALANAEHALALAPDLPQAHYALGYVYRFGFADLDKALAQFKIAQRGAPNSAEIVAAIAYVQGIQGDIPAEVGSLQRAADLNPRDPNLALALGWGLTSLRHYDQAATAYRRTLAIAPNDPEAYTAMARLLVLQHADVPAALAWLDKAPADLQAGAEILSARVELLLLQRDYKAAQQAVDTLRPGGRFVSPLSVLMLRATVSRVAGDNQAAQALYRQALDMATAAARAGLNEVALVGEAAIPIAQAGLGHRAEALQALENVRALARKMDGGALVDRLSLARAQVYVLLGDGDAAIAPLDKALALPLGNAVSVPLLKLDPSWDPLRNDPRFQALLKKYGSDAPTQDVSKQ
jgi:TolB-like protein/Flp pilus assembly protein TadD